MHPLRHAPLLTLMASVVVGALAACDDSAGGSSPDAVADATTEADTSVDPDKGLGVDYSATSGGPVVRYEPGSAEFTATPWPTDRLRRADGSVDLSVFPNPQNLGLLDQYLTYGAETLDGYSRNGAVYFQLSAAIDPASLPSDEASLTDPKALVQLVDVTEGSADYGRQLPLVFEVTDEVPDAYYLGPTLALRPVYGFPLADGATYCAIVTRGLTDADGRYLEPAPAFVEALANEASLAPLRAWLPGSRLVAEDLAGATCFTTQDATGELRRIQALLSRRETGALFEVTATGMTQHFHEVQAKYLGPNFQAGDKPYTSEGGGLRFDADGDPVVQEDETIRVRLLVPRAHEMPAGGWPVVLYSHGTGGSWRSCLDPVATIAAQQGLATICIDQPLHGIRGVGDDDNFLNSFNFLNPASARTSFRQAAADSIWLAKMIADGRFDLGAELAGAAGEVALDPDKIVFFGHSHGGLAGVLLLGVDPRIKGAVLSGAAGVMVETILRRKDVADIEALAALAMGTTPEALDTFHPVVNLIQLLVDATDPINYAPYWLEPVTGGRPKHVFMTEGTEDAASPAVGADAVAAAAGIPLISPVVHASRAHELRGLAPVTMPVSSNLISATGQLVTGGLKQYDGGDHFVAFHDADAIATWRGFLRAMRTSEVPTIAIAP